MPNSIHEKNAHPLPPDMSGTVISGFANAFAKTPVTPELSLSAFLEGVASEKSGERIERLRKLRKTDKAAYDAEKKKLPAVTLSGTCTERKDNSMLKHSGLMQVDLDHLDQPERVRDEIAADPHCCAAFLSPSGEGVKAIFRVPADLGRHSESFNAVQRYIREKYGLENDPACKNPSRLCFTSYDPDLKKNPNAVPLDIEKWSGSQEQAALIPPGCDSGKLEHIPRPPAEEAERVRDALRFLSSEKYEDWVRCCAALKNSGLPGAYELWHEWSATASNYKDEPNCRELWDSFTPNSKIDHTAIYKAATAAGWNSPSNAGVQQAKPEEPKEWREPAPLPEKVQSPPTLAPEILPEPLGEFCKFSAQENEVSAEAVAGFLLSAVGAIIGTRFSIKPDAEAKSSWYEYTNLSVALVMPVSANKTSCFRSGLGPLDRIQAKYDAQYRKEREKWKTREEIHTKEKSGLLKVLEARSAKDDEKKAVKQKLESLKAPDQPVQNIVVINRATPEKIVQLAASGNGRGILMKADEITGLIAEAERSGNEGRREFYIEAMTVSRNYSAHTIGRGSESVDTLALSIAGCVQPSKLQRLLKELESGFKDDGLLQRFLWVWPAPVYFGDFEDVSGIPDQLQDQVHALFEILDTLLPAKIGATNIGHSVSALVHWIGFDKEAQETWRKWRKLLRSTIILEEGLSEGYVAWLGKSERLVAGLALTFHCVECAEGRINEPKAIGDSELGRAIDVWETLRHHARRVFEMNQTWTLEAVHLLAGKLASLGPKFSLRDVKQRNWSGLKDDSVLQEALDWLCESGHLREFESPRSSKGGRPPSRRFEVNPIFEEKA